MNLLTYGFYKKKSEVSSLLEIAKVSWSDALKPQYLKELCESSVICMRTEMLLDQKHGHILKAM